MTDKTMYASFDRLFSSIGMCLLPKNRQSAFSARFGQTLGFSLVLLNLTVFDVTSLIFMWHRIEMGDVENSLYTFLQADAATGALLSALSIFFQRKNVRTVFSQIQVEVDKSET